MDFTSESYIFDPLQVDSSHIPIVNFSEYDEYPKRYINTQNPLGKKNEFVNISWVLYPNDSTPAGRELRLK